MIPLAESTILAGFLAFCRIGACFMLMPGLSSVRVPMMVRLFIAIAVTMGLSTYLWDQVLPYADRSTAVLLPRIASELIIGALIGLLCRIYVMALQFMGTGIAMLIGYTGMGNAGVQDGEPEAALAGIISFGALLLLFIFDFHHQVIRALVDSYAVAPPGTLFGASPALIDIGDTLGDSFLIALRLASPFVAYALLVNLTVGFVNKLVPQIPVYFISLPFILAGGLVLLYLGLGTLLSLFADGFGDIAIGG